MSSDETQTSTKGASLMAKVLAPVAGVVVLVALSLGCWYIWDTALSRFEGRCVGPFCIQTDATTEGNSAIEH